MKNTDFYDVIDSEITTIISNNKENDFLNKQTGDNKKTYAFLLWFLKTFTSTTDFKCITDGSDDNSCDIIFSNKDQHGKTIYYVIQSKWCIRKNISQSIKSQDIKSTINDFRQIVEGTACTSKNEAFKAQYNKLNEHKNKNGKIRFIFLTLNTTSEEVVKENSKGFTSNLISIETFNIYKLKELYIKLNYKGIRTENPLETPYEPIEDIELLFEQGNFISIEKPYASKIFIVRPSVIHRLFCQYGQSLFNKNIRNPLDKSNFNKQIGETLKSDPINFWYYNNGITAITEKIDDFHTTSKSVTIRGMQIINGAQTVYAIYDTFEAANDGERLRIDENAFISLRLLQTGSDEFDTKVTRYTNSQNPIYDRDFCANDKIQERLQRDFLSYTDIWYETRRGEFRKKNKNVSIVSNEKFAQSYLAYFLRSPLDAKNRKKDLFKINKDLYSKIFNKNTKYDDMLVSYLINDFVNIKKKYYKDHQQYGFIQYSTFEIMSLMNILISRLHKDTSKDVNGAIISFIKNRDHNILNSYYDCIRDYIETFIPVYCQSNKISSIQLSKLFKKINFIDCLKNDFEKTNLIEQLSTLI